MLKIQFEVLQPNDTFTWQYRHTHGHFNCPKPFFKILNLSLHLIKDLWGSFLHTVFLLNHSFQVFLPDFLHLHSIYSPQYIIFSRNCIPVFPQEVVGPKFTWTSSNHVLLHVSQRAVKSGASSTICHGPSFSLKASEAPGCTLLRPGTRRRERLSLSTQEVYGEASPENHWCYLSSCSLLFPYFVCAQLRYNLWSRTLGSTAPSHHLHARGARQQGRGKYHLPGYSWPPGNAFGLSKWRQEKPWGKTFSVRAIIFVIFIIVITSDRPQIFMPSWRHVHIEN